MFETRLYRNFIRFGIEALSEKERAMIAKSVGLFPTFCELDDERYGRTYSPNPDKVKYSREFYEKLSHKISEKQLLFAEDRGIIDMTVDYMLKYAAPLQPFYQRFWKPEYVRFHVHPMVMSLYRAG